MNRRKYLLSTLGIGTGIVFGTSIGTTGNTSIAADINIDDFSIPENQVDDNLKFEFSRFNISTTRIETSDENPLEIKLKIKNENNEEIKKHTWEFVLENENNTNIDIEKASTKGELTPVSFDSINEIIENEVKENDNIELKFEIKIKHSGSIFIEETNNIFIDVRESKIPESEGGDIKEEIELDGDKYRLHIFTSNGEFEIDSDTKSDILIVGGGGGGGGRRGGGGGAGEVIQKEIEINENKKDVIIGKGGEGGKFDGRGNSGEDSKFGDLTAKGGGGGGHGEDGTSMRCRSSQLDGKDGGSGGGAGGGGGNSNGCGSGGNSIIEDTKVRFGNNGGDASNYGGDGVGGGGGGAGERGENEQGSGTAGNGGDGKDFSNIFSNFDFLNEEEYQFVNEDGWFAGGGGGGTQNSSASPGSGGNGGGGSGSTSNGNDATQNTGSGGGGAGDDSDSSGSVGGDGADGIVIVRIGPL